jgi:hypothetical protein
LEKNERKSMKLVLYVDHAYARVAGGVGDRRGSGGRNDVAAGRADAHREELRVGRDAEDAVAV